MFNSLWDDLEIELINETILDFVPPEGMQFNFESAPFELFVDFAIWYHDEQLLVVSFKHIEQSSEEGFIDVIRSTIDSKGWDYRANKKASGFIDGILT